VDAFVIADEYVSYSGEYFDKVCKSGGGKRKNVICILSGTLNGKFSMLNNIKSGIQGQRNGDIMSQHSAWILREFGL